MNYYSGKYSSMKKCETCQFCSENKFMCVTRYCTNPKSPYSKMTIYREGSCGYWTKNKIINVYRRRDHETSES